MKMVSDDMSNDTHISVSSKVPAELRRQTNITIGLKEKTG